MPDKPTAAQIESLVTTLDVLGDDMGHDRVLRLLRGLIDNWPADAGDKGLHDAFTKEQLAAIIDAAYDPPTH